MDEKNPKSFQLPLAQTKQKVNGKQKDKIIELLGKKHKTLPLSQTKLNLFNCNDLQCKEVTLVNDDAFAFKYNGKFDLVANWETFESNFIDNLLKNSKLEKTQIKILGTSSGCIILWLERNQAIIEWLVRMCEAFRNYVRNNTEPRVRLSTIIRCLCDLHYEGSIQYEYQNNIYDDMFFTAGDTLLTIGNHNYQIEKSVIHPTYITGLSLTTLTLKRIPETSLDYKFRRMKNTIYTAFVNMTFPVGGIIASAFHINNNPIFNHIFTSTENTRCSFKLDRELPEVLLYYL